MVQHPDLETLSEHLDGQADAGVADHVEACATCQGELEALRTMRAELRSLPELEPPSELWSAIEDRLPTAGRRRIPTWLTQAAAIAAVFVLGLGVGRWTDSAGPAGAAGGGAGGAEPGPVAQRLASESSATSLTEAMADVRRIGAEYDAALRRLDRVANERGTSVPSLAEQRLAALDVLVDASRTALASEPADPTLNAYLFAALEQRAEVMREIGVDETDPDSEIMWR